MKRSSLYFLAVAAVALNSTSCSDEVSTDTDDLTQSVVSCDVREVQTTREGGILVDQCVSKGTTATTKLNSLSVTYFSHRGPFYNSGKFHGAMSEVVVILNGVTRNFPMECDSRITGGNGEEAECKVIVRNADLRHERPEDGPVVDSKLFKFARRDKNRILNAWDVELAFRLGNDWDSLDGQNYRVRFEERDLTTIAGSGQSGAGGDIQANGSSGGGGDIQANGSSGVGGGASDGGGGAF